MEYYRDRMNFVFTKQEWIIKIYEDVHLQLYTSFNYVPYKKFWVRSTLHSEHRGDRDTGFILTGAAPVNGNTYHYGYGNNICSSKKIIQERNP
jgi:hypothetical protein